MAFEGANVELGRAKDPIGPPLVAPVVDQFSITVKIIDKYGINKRIYATI